MSVSKSQACYYTDIQSMCSIWQAAPSPRMRRQVVTKPCAYCSPAPARAAGRGICGALRGAARGGHAAPGLGRRAGRGPGRRRPARDVRGRPLARVPGPAGRGGGGARGRGAGRHARLPAVLRHAGRADGALAGAPGRPALRCGCCLFNWIFEKLASPPLAMRVLIACPPQGRKRCGWPSTSTHLLCQITINDARTCSASSTRAGERAVGQAAGREARGERAARQRRGLHNCDGAVLRRGCQRPRRALLRHLPRQGAIARGSASGPAPSYIQPVCYHHACLLS